MRRPLFVLLVPALGLGCGGSPNHAGPVKIVMETEIVRPAAPAVVIAAAPIAAAPAPEPAPAGGPLGPIVETIEAVRDGRPYAASIRSVRLAATATLRKAPSADAAAVGVIRRGTHAGVVAVAPGGAASGCARGRWIQLAPRGWACEASLAPSLAPPTAADPATLDAGTGGGDGDTAPVVAGVYGVVVAKDATAYATPDEVAAGEGRALVGPHTVRVAGAVDVDGRRFWRTSAGDLIDAAAIAVIGPSRFKGVALAEGAPLPAWVRAQPDPRKPAVLRGAPASNAARTGTLAPRTVVTIRETSADGAFVRIDDGAWIARADLRAAAVVAPPPGTAATERWFDVDLDEQVLVAYEGARPVYATLVSTGKHGHTTPALIARVSSKLLTSDMVSTQQERYSVADVPWTMFYDGNYALHTSYWHDGFGGPRSHGCINLAPRDARALYQWSSPDVPPGWIAVYGDEDHPGSLIRVRSRTAPAPAYRGYARTLRERVASL